MGDWLRYLLIHVVFLALLVTASTNNKNVLLLLNNSLVTGGNITVGETRNVELTYVLRSGFSGFDLTYNNEKDSIVSSVDGSKLEVSPNPSNPHLFLNDTTSFSSNSTWKWFSFFIINVDESLDRKKFAYSCDYIVDTDKGEHILNVQFGPKELRGFNPVYHVNEHTNLTIMFLVRGNPEPSISWNLGNSLQQDSFQLYKELRHNYSIKLNSVSRSHCNKTLTLNVTGYKRISEKSKILVNFKPDPPKITNATIENKDLNVRWIKINAGNCFIVYILTYKYKNRSYNKTCDELTCSGLLDVDRSESFNITVYVQAVVNGQISNPSEPFNVPYNYTYIKQSPPTSKLYGRKNGSVGLNVGIIIGVILVACGVVCCFFVKRTHVTEFCRNKIRNL